MSVLKDFQQWLIEDGKSPKTIESYCNDVKQFQLYLAKKAADEKQPLFRFSIVRYKQNLLDHEFKTSTINKKVNSSFNSSNSGRKGILYFTHRLVLHNGLSELC